MSAVYRSARPFCVRSITNKRLGALAAVTLASLVAFIYFVDARAQTRSTVKYLAGEGDHTNDT